MKRGNDVYNEQFTDSTVIYAFKDNVPDEKQYFEVPSLATSLEETETQVPGTGLANACGEIYDRKLYMYGGIDDVNLKRDLYVYHIDLKRWVTLQSNSTGRNCRNCDCAFLNDNLFVYGGYNNIEHILPSTVLSSELAGYWAYDEADDLSSTITDLSSNSNNATIVGGIDRRIGSFDKCIHLDGITHITIPDDTSLNFGTNSFTIATSIKVSRQRALKYRVSSTASTNSYLYTDLSSVTDYVIQSGDYLEYDVYWTQPGDLIGFDYTCIDNTDLRDSGAVDQNGISCHPTTDITTFALGKWYHRKIALPSAHIGKTITYFDIVCEANDTSVRTGYINNVKITDGAGTVRKVIYNPGDAFTYASHLTNNASLVELSNDDIYKNLIYKGATAGFSGWRFGIQNGTPHALIGDTVTHQEGVLSTETIDDGKWHRLLITYDRVNNLITSYIDGVLSGTPLDVSTVTGSVDNTSDIVIGNTYTMGIIELDETRIYNRLLTTTEIQEDAKLTCGYLDDFASYNISTNTWTQKSSGPKKVYNHSLTEYNNKLYLIGGIDHNNIVLDEIWEYDITLDTWVQKTSIPVARNGHRSILVGDSIYVSFGSSDNYDTFLSDFWRYDILTDTWTQLTEGPVPRSEHGIFCYDNKIYIYGGRDKYVVYTDVWEYDIASNSWTQVRETTTKRCGFVYGSIEDSFYIMGGYEG